MTTSEHTVYIEVKKPSEMAADTDPEQNSAPKNISCLICKRHLGVSSQNSYEIFHKNVCTSSTGRPLSFIIGAVLEHEIGEDAEHSNVICENCFNLLDEADKIESRLAEIKVELTASYKRTIKIQSEGVNEEEEDDYKLPLSSDDPNIVKEKILASSCKKPTPKKIKSFQSTGNSEEVYKLKDSTLFEMEISDHDSEYHPDMLPSNNGDGDGNDKEVAKIKIEPKDEPGDLNKDMMERKIIKKKPKTELEIPDKLICREGTNFSCLLCTSDEKIMGDMTGIINHMKNVHNIKVYVCDICGQDFRKHNELSVHLDDHEAAEGDFQCEVCHHIFSNLRLFRVHKRMHSPQSKLLTCETCGKHYSSQNLLDEHINTHTRVHCEVCGKIFASKYTYKKHTKTHKVRPRPFSCQECGKAFLSAQNLTQHQLCHTGIRNYRCDQCGKAFGTAGNLQRHSVVHTGYKPFICHACGKAFAHKADFKDHQRSHTGEKPYQCEFCGATFSRISNFLSHKRAVHIQDKRFKCTECGGKSFARKADFRDHVRTHTGEKPYQCEFCGATFRLIRRLQSHKLAIHNQDKCYKCTECGEGFRDRQLLGYHMKADHTGECPYKCRTCNAKFVYPEHFKKHQRIHIREKPFLCEVCDKAFSSRYNRDVHRFVHSDKKHYECLVCGTGFMRKPLLYNHMQTQGHLNNKIIVNQLSFIPAEDLLQEIEELVNIDGLGQHQGQEAKLYIAELKEPVIIQQDGNNRHLGERTHALKDTKEEVDQHMVQVGEGHHTLVVPATPRIMPTSGQNVQDPHQAVVEDSSTITTLTTTHGLQRGTLHDGPLQIMQIIMPSEPGNNSRAWVNLVDNAQ